MLALDAIRVWFDEVRAPLGESEHTIRAYRGDLRALLDVIARQQKTSVPALTVDDIAPLDVIRRAFGWWSLNGPKGNRRAASSVHRAHSTWTVFFDWLVSEGLVPGSPMPGVRKPKRAKKLPKAFTPEAADRIVDAVQGGAVPRRDPWPELEQAIVLTDLITGARTSELLGMNVEDVNRVPGAEGLRVLGKGNSERYIPVEPEVVAVLAAYLATRRERFPETARKRGIVADADEFKWWDPKAPLFVGRKGERLTVGALAYMIELVYRAAGVEAERVKGALTHAMRHTAATRAAEGRASVFQLQQLFGWKTLTTPQHYVEATAHEVRDAASRNPVYGRLRAPQT